MSRLCVKGIHSPQTRNAVEPSIRRADDPYAVHGAGAHVKPVIGPDLWIAETEGMKKC